MVAKTFCPLFPFPGVNGRFLSGAEVSAMTDVVEIKYFYILKQALNQDHGSSISLTLELVSTGHSGYVRLSFSHLGG